jgi:hypothetical protein
VIEGSVVTVGKSEERSTFTAAAASRKFASASSTFWLLMLTFSSSAFSSRSW